MKKQHKTVESERKEWYNSKMNTENTSERSGKTFIISDTHWGHERVIEFGNRPQDFNQKIISNWRQTVLPQDTVIHLGDVAWGSKERLYSIMNQLTGTIVLVRGNHDKSHSDSWFRDTGFSFVCQKVMIGKILLSHMPSRLTEEEIEYGVKNIHGHFHNIDHKMWEKNLIARLTDSHYLLAIELVDYKPILLSRAFEKNYVIRSNDILKGVATNCPIE